MPEKRPCHFVDEILPQQLVAFGVGVQIVGQHVRQLLTEQLQPVHVVNVGVAAGPQVNRLHHLLSHVCQAEAHGVAFGLQRWRKDGRDHREGRVGKLLSDDPHKSDDGGPEGRRAQAYRGLAR